MMTEDKREDYLAQQERRADQYAALCDSARNDGQGERCSGPIFDYSAQSHCKRHSIARGVY